MPDLLNPLELAQPAALLEQMAAELPGVVWATDTELRFTASFGAGLTALEVAPGEFVGKTLFDLIQTEDQTEPIIAAHRRALQGESVKLRYGWSGRVYRVHLEPLRARTGGVLGCVGFARDVTDSERVEEALRDSEARFRGLFQDSGVGAVVVALDGRFLHVNRAFCEFLGYSQQDLIGRSIQSITHPDDWTPNAEAISRTLAGGPRTQRMEKRYLHKSGRVLWGDVQFSLVANVAGHPEYFITQVLDITGRKQAEVALQKAHADLEHRVAERTAELAHANQQLQTEVGQRRRAEEALQQSERRFRNYFEQGLIGMAVTAVDGRWLEVNERLCQMLGRPRECLVQKRWMELTHPDDLTHDLAQFERLLASEIDHFTLDKRFLRPDGSVLYATLHARAFRKEDGSVDHIVALLEDITARHEAEEALQQSHDQLHAIYAGLVDGVLIVDLATGQFVHANEAMCRMLGYSMEELLSMSLKDIHTEEQLHASLQAIQAQIERRMHVNPNVPVLRKDGSVFYADVAGRAIAFAGRPCAIGFFRDITERRRAQEVLERERRTLAHLLRASDHERQLIAYDIHDGLAQQLAGAIMQFEVFEHLKETQPKQAADAYRAAVTLLRQGHFEARRLISGVRPPILDESGVVAAVAHLVHEQNRERGPRIDYRSRVMFRRLAPVLENSIYRIIQEGLSNACKHSQSEVVRIGLVQRADKVRIHIQDWGRGFDPATVAENHFGLEGIRERARLLGGTARIRSIPGQGASIRVELPLVERDEEA